MMLLAVLLVLATVTFTEQASVSATEEMRTVANANNNFTVRFAQYLKENAAGDNVVFSSVSASTVLAGLAEGAAGNTRSQLLAALNLPDDDDTIRNGYRKIINSYDTALNCDMTLNMADAMFLANKFTPKASFADTMQRDFSSAVRTLNFESGTSAMDTINTWVSQHTNGRIQKLYEQGDLSPDTQIVLANAVYFKGAWKTSFNKNWTFKRPFHLSSTKSVSVDTMTVTSKFVVYSDNDLQAKVLEIPYSADEMKMVIVLPFQIDGLDKTVKSLTGIPKPSGVVTAENYKINVPKFNITSNMYMGGMLESFGITDAFSSKADFSKISSEKILLSTVKQTAFVEVNEEGTEAAAATGNANGLPEIPELLVNHPFLYFIVHVSTDTAVFSGFIRNP